MWGTLEGSLVNLQLDNAIAPLGGVANRNLSTRSLEQYRLTWFLLSLHDPADFDRVTFYTFVPPFRIWKFLTSPEKTCDVVSSSWFNVLYSPTITSPDVLWLSLELHTLMSPDFVFPMHCVANHSIADVYISTPLCTLLFCTASPISFPVSFLTYFLNNLLTKNVKNTGF